MTAHPFGLLRKWILSMIGAGQASGELTETSEIARFEEETQIEAQFLVYCLETGAKFDPISFGDNLPLVLAVFINSKSRTLSD